MKILDEPQARATLAGHDRIALLFSGGRDSLAVLYLLREFWDRLTVYHCDTGDAFPETAEVVARVAKEVPHFVTIQGSSQHVQALLGYPTDLLPARATPLGQIHREGMPLLCDRYTCCFHTYMLPSFHRMLEDGMTLVIRGQRDADYSIQPLRSGDTREFEVYYPVQDWTSEDIDQYLASIGVAPAPFYKRGLSSTLDCMHCTAWGELGTAKYVREYYPEISEELAPRRLAIKLAITEQLAECEV